MASGLDTNDDLYYLQPDFDLNSLTVPRLRSILVNHDVPYPASAKKSQLVAILESDVIPKAKKLLRERERVRRTSKGITNMPNHNDAGADVEEEVETRDRQQRSMSRATRSSTRASTAESEYRATSPLSVAKRRTRGPSKHPRSSDTDMPENYETTTPLATPIRPSGRKSRKSEAYHTPHASHYDEVVTPTPIRSDYTAETVFTDDNPFQGGGSSPLDTPQARGVSSEQRRKSGMRRLSEAEERRKRRSELRTPVKVKQEEDIQVPSRSTFDVPISRFDKTPKFEEPPDYDVGEEFTPDEQLALDQEAAYSGRRRSILRGQTQNTSGSSGTVASWFVILTLLSGFGLWWRKEKLDIGYCGVGKAHWSLEDTNVPSWANVIEPQCEVCPQHAFCYPNFEAGCEQGFVLKPHPLSLGGIIPLPPTCEADGEKARRIKVVADKAVEELRTQRAKFECGESTQETDVVSTPEVTATELQEKVGSLRRKGMSDEEFEDLWKGALGEITGREEIVVSTGPSSSSDLRLTSTSLAKLSLSCSIRRHLRLSLLAYRLPILVLVICLSFAAYIRSRILAGRSDAARVPSLVRMTLDRLATQAALHARGEALEPWISVGQLRDDVLRDELRGSRREKLWKRVRTIVEGNANVRASVREGRGGDVSRVWEWIGGVSGVVNEWDSASRRESSKVKFSLSPSSEGAAVHSPEPSSRRESRKWDEGRAIY
ncbi:hypothetical protein FQN49_005399 [Arthroderma sp. PD_2]|nr:hypothetical protein FQN49_005399 [Arthroderma sp. PD_2]